MSWHHTVAQKLRRFEKYDEKDIKAILKHLTQSGKVHFEWDPQKVLNWLNAKLPLYNEDLKSLEKLYISRLKKRVFPL